MDKSTGSILRESLQKLRLTAQGNSDRMVESLTVLEVNVLIKSLLYDKKEE